MGFVSAQIGIPAGVWRTHKSYKFTSKVETFNDLTFGASEYGVYYVNTKNNETTSLNKSEGLHTGVISILRANENYLVVGYSDGYIDVINKNLKVKGISGFFETNFTGDKSISHVKFQGNIAYLATNAGILKVDLNIKEIVDNFQNIGNAGAIQPVSHIDVKQDTIFAATNNGIIFGLLNGITNLSDFSNWNIYLSIPKLEKMAFYQNQLYYAADSQVYIHSAGLPQKITSINQTTWRLETSNNDLFIIRAGESMRVDPSRTRNDLGLNVVADCDMTASGDLWYVNGFTGGLLFKSQTGEISFQPNGPASFDIFHMSKEGPLVYCTAGGATNTFGNLFNISGFYISNNGQWENNPRNEFNDSIFDFTYAYHLPKLDKYYLLSQSFGMTGYKENKPVEKFNQFNSSLGVFPTTNYARTSGVSLDNKGVLFVTNFGSQNAISVYNGSTWKALNPPKENLKTIITDRNNFKWILLHNEGLMVLNDNGTPFEPADDIYRLVNTTNSKILTNEVKSIAIDDNNWLWIGTSLGLNVITNLSEPFTDLQVEQLTVNDIDGKAAYLLGENSINDICVDGGNRKWFATNNGVVLVEADGQNQVAKFTAANSPLPDDRVVTIGQSSTTGEVYFGTTKGIVSYQSDAGAKKESFGKIKVYPNPVTPGYSGLITIDGLATNAEIRITDANGMLVSQLKANGSKAVCNGLRLNGTKPNSGVYYIFGINADATETAMGKFIFVR